MNLQGLVNSIPAPSTADMAERRQFARRYTLVFLRKGLALPENDEAHNEQLQVEHLQHLTN